MKKSYWIIAILAFILVLVMNTLATTLPLGGQTTGEISDKYPSLFTPAGFTFSIWGIIYLFLISFVIYQALPQNRNRKLLNNIRPFFIANCFANASWIVAWHYDMLALSILIMFIILLTLIMIYKKLYLWEKNSNLKDIIFVQIPFSLYLGWITVATVANLSAIQIGFDYDNWLISAPEWTALKIGLAVSVGSLVIFERKDWVFILVIIWAIFGIFSKHVGNPAVYSSTVVALFVLVFMLIFFMLKKIKKAI